MCYDRFVEDGGDSYKMTIKLRLSRLQQTESGLSFLVFVGREWSTVANQLRDTRRTQGWFWMDNKVISEYGARLGPIGIAVYNSILYHANADGTGAWPSYTTIAKQIGCSRPPVIDAVNKLVELDLLKKEVRPVEGNRHLPNLYTVLDIQGKGDLPCRVKEVYPVGKGGLPDQDPITNTPLTKTRSKKASGKPPPTPTPSQAMFSGIGEAYRFDLNLLTEKQRGRLNAVGKRIRKAEYTVEEVQAAGAYWWAQDWRGQKGSIPTDTQFFETLSKLRQGKGTRMNEAESW